MSRLDRLRNGLYQRLLDVAGSPTTLGLVRGAGRRLARWRRRRARRRPGS